VNGNLVLGHAKKSLKDESPIGQRIRQLPEPLSVLFLNGFLLRLVI
jgi:hypothetical protein